MIRKNCYLGRHAPELALVTHDTSIRGGVLRQGVKPPDGMSVQSLSLAIR